MAVSRQPTHPGGKRSCDNKGHAARPDRNRMTRHNQVDSRDESHQMSDANDGEYNRRYN